MAKAIAITGEWTASELRRLAGVLDGMNRTEAARIGGMDRQTLRDWAKPARGSGERSSLERLAEGHRFNERGPEGLKDDLAREKPRRLTQAQQAELAAIVEAGADRAVHGVVRWGRVDLQALVAERFEVASHERTIGKLRKALGFSHVSARPRHPKQDGEVITAFKKTSRAGSKLMSAG